MTETYSEPSALQGKKPAVKQVQAVPRVPRRGAVDPASASPRTCEKCSLSPPPPQAPETGPWVGPALCIFSSPLGVSASLSSDHLLLSPFNCASSRVRWARTDGHCWEAFTVTALLWPQHSIISLVMRLLNYFRTIAPQ